MNFSMLLICINCKQILTGLIIIHTVHEIEVLINLNVVFLIRLYVNFIIILCSHATFTCL